MELLARVRRFIAHHDLIPPGARVVAAVSGGSDSVALACLLHELHAAGDLHLAGLAHFNHQLRATADRDERHVIALADALDVPVLTDRADVAARATKERRSIEDAARRARYAFYRHAVDHFRADAIALGHTRDDQAETFLLRLIRGAGPRGLAAMYPRNGIVVRPLLECRRDELRAYLDARRAAGLRAATWVHDESNDDVSIPRNRVRAELLPLLVSRFNPSIVDVLAGEAAIARDTWEWLDRASADTAARLVAAGRPHVRVVEVDAFRAVPRAVQRAVLWRVMTELAGNRPVGVEHVEEALRVADVRGPECVDAPGQRVQRIGARIVLTGRPAGTVGRWTPPANLFRYPLSIPGEVVLREVGWTVSAELVSAAELSGPNARRAITGNGAVAAVCADRVGHDLAVRNRRPGDRFRPAGVAGRRKLQDFFVDRKVARGERDSVPLVVDSADRIVWVAGHRIDEGFQVTGSADHVLLLRLKAVGGSA